MKAKQIFSLVSVIGVLLTGCHQTTQVLPTKMTVTSEEIKVILNSERNLNDIVTLKFEPKNTTEKNVTWSSEVNEILTLQGSIIQANKIGKAKVTATSVANKNLKKDVIIKVYDPNSNQYFVNVDKPEEVQLIGLQDTYLAGSLVSFSIQLNNPQKEIANVFVNDLILSAKNDMDYEFLMPFNDVTLCVTTQDKGTSIAATSVQLNPSSLTLIVGNEDATIHAIVEPSNTTESAQWSISEGNDVIRIQTLQNQVTVHALKAGNAKIKVTYNSNVQAECAVTVQSKNDGELSVKYNIVYDLGTSKVAKKIDTPTEVFDTFQLVEDENPILSSVSQIENIYGGGYGGRNDTAWYAGNMLKLGTTSVNGSLTLELNTAIQRIKITGYVSDKSSKIRVGNSLSTDWNEETDDNTTVLVSCTDMEEATKTTIEMQQTATITIDFAATTSLKIATTNKKPFYITAIEFVTL